MMCRAYLTLWACSLALGCLVGLSIANRLLMALDDDQEAARRRLAQGHEHLTFPGPDVPTTTTTSSTTMDSEIPVFYRMVN